MDAAEDVVGDAAAPPGPRWAAALIGVVVAAGSAFIGLPVAFLIAYGFAEQVTTFMHVVFLVLSLVLALVAAGITWPVLSAGMRYGAARGLGGALALVGATYGATLGVGTLVAMLNEGQNSVTADQPNAPFVVLVLACAALAIGGAVAAARVLATSAQRGRRAPRVGVEPTSLVLIQSQAGPADRPTGDRRPRPYRFSRDDQTGAARHRRADPPTAGGKHRRS